MLILFIGPITDKHGQGMMTIEAMNALEGKHDLEKLNTYTPNNSMFSNLLLIIKILLKSKKYTFVYLSISRNLPKSLIDLVVLYKFRAAKIVTHLHGTEFDEKLPIWFKKPLRFLLKSNNVLNIVLSESHMTYAFGDARYKIIPNGVDFKYVETRKGAQDKLVFVHISNPILSKGLDKSLEFFSMIQKEKASIELEFNVIGWTLEDAKKNGIGMFTGVKFHGKLFGDRKEEILCNSDIMLYPTRYKAEAQPLVILEALNCGCKCLISNFKMMNDFTEFHSVRLIDEFKSLDDVMDFNKNDFSIQTRNKLAKYSLKEYQKNILECFV